MLKHHKIKKIIAILFIVISLFLALLYKYKAKDVSDILNVYCMDDISYFSVYFKSNRPNIFIPHQPPGYFVNSRWQLPKTLRTPHSEQLMGGKQAEKIIDIIINLKVNQTRKDILSSELCPEIIFDIEIFLAPSGEYDTYDQLITISFQDHENIIIYTKSRNETGYYFDGKYGPPQYYKIKPDYIGAFDEIYNLFNLQYEIEIN